MKKAAKLAQPITEAWHEDDDEVTNTICTCAIVNVINAGGSLLGYSLPYLV
jgi:hypothetical protein